MSYTALYRKLRPPTFAGVIGQEHIIRTILNEIKTERISHAYLFCGTRGTGKTSTAKIFAKTINCYNQKDGEPCNECESCLAIDAQRSMNVMEIDAASNNGVENIRDIREEVKYPPTEGKFKVYIIDEVHMLSTGAFNALLKTLEEPPEHVIFILATTDPQKIPATILSRCQRFDFRRISSRDMVLAIKEYMEGENVSVHEDALKYIAQISDGAMRDALSILDQCIAFYFDQTITMDMVLEVVGSVDNTVLFALTDALYKGNSTTCMEIIDEFIMKGRDVSQFVNELITHLRNLLVSASLDNQSIALDLSDETVARLKEQASQMNPTVLIHYINHFSALQSQMRYASNERILLEVACIRLCNPETEDSQATLYLRMKNLEAAVEKGIQISAHAPVTPEVQAVAKPAPQKIREKAVPDDMKQVIEGWKDFATRFENPLRSMLEKAMPKYLEGDSLCLTCNDLTSPKFLESKQDLLKENLYAMFEKEFNLSIMNIDEYNTRHKKMYGMEDNQEFSTKTYTDLLGEDIITFED